MKVRSTARWTALVLAVAACTETRVPPAGDPHDEWDDKLAEREVDYSAALRTAALRLTGDLPTLAEIKLVASATDKKTAYEQQIRTYLASPKFARQMFRFWQDTFKMGDAPELDSAAAFAAELVVQDRSYLDLFLASSGTCPSFDMATGQFTPGNCTNGAPVTVGLLTHPGMLKHFTSNLAFRRTRWVQETFACTAFPAEIAPQAKPLQGALLPYTGTFPFESIAGQITGGRVDFRDTQSIICANCHSNINHIAPLFAFYDDQGQYHSTMVAPTPLPDAPPVVMGDYLPVGEMTAWRHGVPVADMQALGRAMAGDRAIAECAIARVWDWALGKQDIVDGSARVPTATIAAQVETFMADGYKLRDAIFAAFTSDDFVRF